MNEIAKREEVINTVVQRVLDKIKGLISTTVKIYWDIGHEVALLDREYGASVVKDFGVTLAKRLGRDEAYSESTLSRAQKFATMFSEEQRDLMIEHGVSWTQIIRILPISNQQIIDACLRRLEAGEITGSDLSDAIESMVRPPMDNPANSVVDEPMVEARVVEDTEPKENPEPRVTVEKDEPHSTTVNANNLRQTCIRVRSTMDSCIAAMGDVLMIIDLLKRMDGDEAGTYMEEVNSMKEGIRGISVSGKAASNALNSVEFVAEGAPNA